MSYPKKLTYWQAVAIAQMAHDSSLGLTENNGDSAYWWRQQEIEERKDERMRLANQRYNERH